MFIRLKAVLDEGIEVDQWPDFIVRQLKSAENWVDMKKVHALKKK